MNSIAAEVVVGQLLTSFREAFEVPADAPYTLFADKGAGLLQVLDGVSAADASRPVGANTVAGQAAHAVIGLKAAAGWIGTKSTDGIDWSNPYPATAVDEAGWAKLRAELRAAYAACGKVIGEKGAAGADELAGSIGATAHAAYHLGQVRKMLAVLKAG